VLRLRGKGEGQSEHQVVEELRPKMGNKAIELEIQSEQVETEKTRELEHKSEPQG
jgi:hypothetical protein